MPLFESGTGFSDEGNSDNDFESDSELDIPEICLNYDNDHILQAVAYRPSEDSIKKYKIVIGHLCLLF